MPSSVAARPIPNQGTPGEPDEPDASDARPAGRPLPPVRGAWDRAWFARLHQLINRLADMNPGEAAIVRRDLARDPIAFAVMYMRHHLAGKAETGGRLTFSRAHFEWADIALEWAEPDNRIMGGRHAVIAPRATGKSTWWFLILPLWAAANGYLRFVAAFADAGAQASAHLITMKSEFNDNPLLRHDFPDLCSPGRWQSGTTIADKQSMLKMRNGFVFAARGIDAANLGMKVGNERPGLIILDDVEPDEASYSADQAEKRLTTIIDSIFALNVFARVILVGTVTMPGSIMHQLVKSVKTTETEKWIIEEKIDVRHHRPIITRRDGTQVSIWPAKWPLSWLKERERTREYAKNMDNDPLARDGIYWTRDDFEYGRVDTCTRTGLWIDPAVTTKDKSDFTGLAVVGFSPVERKCWIRYAVGVKLPGKELRLKILNLLELFPEISRVVVEVNQGGDLWQDVFNDLAVPIYWHSEDEPKDVRFARALTSWQHHRVVHAERFSQLEEQAIGYPRVKYDDVIDAAVSPVLRFLHPKKKVKASQTGESYL